MNLRRTVVPCDDAGCILVAFRRVICAKGLSVLRGQEEVKIDTRSSKTKIGQHQVALIVKQNVGRCLFHQPLRLSCKWREKAACVLNHDEGCD